MWRLLSSVEKQSTVAVVPPQSREERALSAPPGTPVSTTVIRLVEFLSFCFDVGAAGRGHRVEQSAAGLAVRRVATPAVLDVSVDARHPPLVAFIAGRKLVAAVFGDLGDGVAAVLVEIDVQRRVPAEVRLAGRQRAPARHAQARRRCDQSPHRVGDDSPKKASENRLGSGSGASAHVDSAFLRGLGC